MKHSDTVRVRLNPFGVIGIVLGLVLAVWGLMRFRGDSPVGPQNRAAPIQTNLPAPAGIPLAEDLKAGRALAEQVCGACHLFPEPDLADRFTWANGILPRMNDWLGYQSVDWTNEPGGHQVIASGKLPREPAIDLASLKLIHNYYLSTAPGQPSPQDLKPPLTLGLKHFKVRRSPHRTGNPMTTLVAIDERYKSILVGDAATKKLAVINAEGVLTTSIDMPSPIVHLVNRPDGFYATMIGSLLPSDLAQGFLTHLGIPADPHQLRLAVRRMLLHELHRPVQCEYADLNGDGRDDLVVASYGNILGHFSWFEQKPEGSYAEHLLLDRPGAVGVKVHDFDGDGRPDIVVVMAQAREGIWLFLNRGQGQFEERMVVQQHPAWGFSHLELADVNQDGKPDLLVTNGDNGDNVRFPNCPKRYHGVRLYLSDGKGEFHESWFYPMYGAYRALARDFDLDGDLDLAAISFFPDYFGPEKESFTYLENLGDLRFSASTFVQSITGRWITMDAGDLDGDGDFDIVLGASNRSFGDVPEGLADAWEKQGPSVLLLENTVRQIK
jgi:hypothetical protein